jgi:tetraacyldisaccharide 4'-kinase
MLPANLVFRNSVSQLVSPKQLKKNNPPALVYVGLPVNRLHNFFLKAWYGKQIWIYLFIPLSWVFCLVTRLRKTFLVYCAQQKIAVPVIVVGNITVGGTGKTPLIIALVEHLQLKGYKPGVVSRGYGGNRRDYPFCIDINTIAHDSGDEPLLIFNATGCKVCIDSDRVSAARVLVEQGCTIILSDDGLQHYRLGRDLEIAVVDGLRLFGNRQLLPVGPLRESVARLKTVDMRIVTGPSASLIPDLDLDYFAMHMEPVEWRKIDCNQPVSLDAIRFTHSTYAVAAIGNPKRFFNTLSDLALTFEEHVFPDHHEFSPEDFAFAKGETVLMTEKDAVKCQSFSKNNWYSLVVSAQLDAAFWKAFDQKLESLGVR